MPQGQIVPSLSMDPATGGIYPPGVILDDDFSVNRLTSYIPFTMAGEVLVDMSRASISGGVLGRTGTGGGDYVMFNNQRPSLISRQMIKVVPGPSADQYVINIFAKILDGNNFLLLHTNSTTPGVFAAYRKVGGVYTRMDSGNIESPSINGSPIWYVFRMFELLPVALANRFRWAIQTFVAPPNIVSVPVTQVTFNIPNIFAVPGYFGLGLGANPPGPNSWTYGEWTVVSDTNRMFF